MLELVFCSKIVCQLFPMVFKVFHLKSLVFGLVWSKSTADLTPLYEVLHFRIHIGQIHKLSSPS